MEYTIIERPADAFQQSIAREQLIAMCRRAFGEEVQIESAQELDGGLYNNTYLIQLNGMPPIILRVSPHPARQPLSLRQLMRNEYASLPFFAPIAPLLPRILMADFTHQIVERDYLFQTYMEGEQWAQVIDTFTSEEKKSLWRQLGTITKKIHAVQNHTFGNSLLGSSFPSWGLTVMDWLMTIIHDLENVQLDATDLRSVLKTAQVYQRLLDEIVQPHLLHGDLWTVNILVKRGKAGPQIVAVLDSDRTSWGDPLADWTIFLLGRHAGTEADAFWETYGQPARTQKAQFRSRIYQACYLGSARLEQHRHKAVQRSYQDMQEVVETLRNLFPRFDSKRGKRKDHWDRTE